jgi:tetratricopeptide (TPR) repeat protein
MTIAERWMYGPLIGLLGILGFVCLEAVKKNIKYLGVFIFVIILFSAVFFVRSFIRTFDWKDDLSLFSHDIKYNFDSFDAQNNLGVALFEEGKILQSEPYFKKSIKLSPKWWTPYNNLGVIYQRQGKIKEAKIMYQKSIDNGNYYLAYENLAQLKASTENPKQVLPFIESSLKVLPDNEALNKVAAFLYVKTGEVQKAKFYATRTYQLDQSEANYLFLKEILNEK